MIRITFKISLSLILLLSGTACTDFVEPDQLTVVLGSGIDYAEDGMIELSHQLVIPAQWKVTSSGGNSSDSNAFVISAKGRNIFEASQNTQRKLSRKLLTNHRIMIAISDEFFEKADARSLFDKLNRDPANNQRDILLMVKGSAREFLTIDHPMEQLSSIAAGKELQINGLGDFTTRRFILDSASEGTRPMVPVLKVEKMNRGNSDKEESIVVLSGFSVLDKELKVKGFLENIEGFRAIWMAGKGTFNGWTIPWKDNEGYLSLRLNHLHRRIHSVQNDPEHIVLTVTAKAYLLENTTSLDMSEVENMIDVEKQINKQVEKELQETMSKVQQWGTDVFGIGEYLHRKYPYWWKRQRDDWDENFKNIEITVKANIQLMSIGTSGSQVKL